MFAEASTLSAQNAPSELKQEESDLEDNSPVQRPGRPGTAALVCSAGLNLLLLAGVAVLSTGRFKPSLTVSPRSASVVAEEPEHPSPATFNGVQEIVTNQISFRWAMLESEDFRTYIANLRAVHCPEPIIQDLVFADLERVYEQKEAALPNPDLFWKPRHVRELAQEKARQQRNQLELEKRALMRDLLGVSWSHKAWEFWYDDSFGSLAELLAGFLRNEQVLEGITIYQDMHSDLYPIDQCELCPEAEEKARQEAAYQRVATAFKAIMLPAEFEEVELRISTLEQADDQAFTEGEFRFTSGAEVRAFASLANRASPFFRKEFIHGQDADESREAQSRSALRALVGEERFAAYERSEESGYREIWKFGQEQQLPKATILKVWQVREAAEQALGELSGRNDLAAAERVSAVSEVRLQTETALVSLLGASTAGKYLEQHGRWLRPALPNSGGAR